MEKYPSHPKIHEPTTPSEVETSSERTENNIGNKVPTNPTIYTPEIKDGETRLVLSDEQKNSVRAITLGIEEVDRTIREMAVDDVIKTLENGHPLNRVITDNYGGTIGYVACEDFIPNEAYIKYFGTTGETGRNLFQEIPEFLSSQNRNVPFQQFRNVTFG